MTESNEAKRQPNDKSNGRQNVYGQMQGVQQPYTQAGPYQAQQQYYPTLPTGAPSGPPFGTPGYGAQVPTTPALVTPPGEQAVTTITSINYIPGYLRTQIGRRVKVEFLIGTNLLIDREGTLVAVGASYIIIQEAETDDLLLCDLYSIKFVRFYY